jgi:Rrf2 family protein
MLKINKKVEYALMALKYMSDHRDLELISAREICDSFTIPFDTTAKVMQTMNNHGILKSVKGIKGGYSLLKPLHEISYMDLVRVVEAKEDIGKTCMSKKGRCELYSKCNIISPVEQLNLKLNIYLETLSLAELLLGTNFNANTKELPLQEANV